MLGYCAWCKGLCDEFLLVPIVPGTYEYGCFRICFDCEENHTLEEYNAFVEAYRKKLKSRLN